MKSHTIRIAAAALLVGALATPAAADSGPSATIGSVQTKPDGMSFVVTVNGMKPGDKLDASSVHVTFEGQELQATGQVTTQPSNPTSTDRVAVIAIDTSGSMRGPGIAGAQVAARDFLTHLPADVQVGLVQFANAATLLVPPTTDRAAVEQAVSALKVSGETSLYDAVKLAVRAAGPFGERHVLVLTDGKDTKSLATLEETVAELKASDVRLDIVAFKTAESDNATLQQIVAPIGGHLHTAADGAAVAKAFQQAAQGFSPQLDVTIDVPRELAGKAGKLTVEVAAGGATIAAESTVTFKAQEPDSIPPKSIAPTRHWSPSGGLIISLALFCVGLFVLLIAAALPRKCRQDRRSRIMEMYARSAPSDAEDEEHGTVAQTLLQWTDRVAKKRGWDEKMALQLDRAGWRLRPHEWLLLRACICFGLIAAWALLVGSVLLGAALGILVGWLGTAGFLHYKMVKRLQAFEAQLPELLQLVTGSLQIGFSLPQALDAAAREGQEPVAGEIRRALAETRLGLPLEDALDKLADRMESDDCRWTVMAIRIQREVGGNLTEVLLTVVKTMRERAALHRQVRALSAEGRLSSYILTGLPIFMALYLFTVRRSYIRPLWNEPLGIFMSITAIVLVIIGTVWMRKMARVEV
jgi:tight adherence protein B